MKQRTHFTRKNFIALSMIFLYLMVVVLCALGLDGTNPVFKKGNPLQAFGTTLGFPLILGSFGAWILLLCVLVYLLLFSAAFIFEMRLAKYYENKTWTKKWSLIYVGTFFLTALLGFGIGSIAQYPYDPEAVGNSYLFLLESLVVGLIVYLVITCVLAAVIGLYVNFKNIDKPFRFFGKGANDELLRQEAEQAEDDEEQDEQGRLQEAFGEKGNTPAKVTSFDAFGADASNARNGSDSKEEEGSPLKDKERVFPGLCTIDYVEGSFRDGVFEDNVSLEEVAERFRNYLAKQEKLYYEQGTIRAFLAGLGSSRLLILEGLSGTGKSSLARYWSEFIGESSFFEAVQATWRDRTSILGFYNDFSRSYNETEFLKRLYQYGYRENHINVMVLDEMNISRIEYYFADFLSVLEYPKDKWTIKIMQFPYDFEPPAHLGDGILRIPENTWFIGTANKDDSTYTITDKVYDRAITLSFSDRNEPFEVTGNAEPLPLSYGGLSALFEAAQKDPALALNKGDLDKFHSITDFVSDTFDLAFGNRIANQIEHFVPVYVASGGSKEEALDFLFARKILFKLQGRFEDYVRDGLLSLRTLLQKTYGEEAFKESQAEITRLLRRI